MATDASIAVSVKDNFSAGITGMKKNLTDFEKEITATTQKIQSLNRQKANVAVRNFPLTADALRKRLRLKDGGDTYIFGTTVAGEHLLLICGKP